MPDDLTKVLTQTSASNASAGTNSQGTVGNSNSSKRTQVQTNPLIDLLTERLTQQGQGIASSSSSNLQKSIDDAIASAQESGNLSNRAIQSVRDREISFARGQASDTYTTAMEGRTGYGTQVAGLRALTETTEKSIRDLDSRYMEAQIANDVKTMETVSNLRMKKMEFQQEQEEKFYSNLMSAASLQQSAIGQMMQSEQFWAGQEESQRQFAMNMAQSNYQFNKNLGIQYKEIELKEQSLRLEADRNNISRAELNAKLNELKSTKNTTALKSMLFNKFMSERKANSGSPIDSGQSLGIATDFLTSLASTGMNIDMKSSDLMALVDETVNSVNEQFVATEQDWTGVTYPARTIGDTTSSMWKAIGESFTRMPSQRTI